MSDEMSLALTRRIENLFAKEYVGGEVQRRAAIQCAINEVISADLAAERERADKAEQELVEWELADNAVTRTLGADYNAALAALKVAREALAGDFNAASLTEALAQVDAVLGGEDNADERTVWHKVGGKND